ncbi:hypothetical protein O5D80_000890 [Batrachochytrium dendrobatidis]|nr:hypothetical protein O5D80_000890 [Batrachochytrium dendrobatidis]
MFTAPSTSSTANHDLETEQTHPETPVDDRYSTDPLLDSNNIRNNNSETVAEGCGDRTNAGFIQSVFSYLVPHYRQAVRGQVSPEPVTVVSNVSVTSHSQPESLQRVSSVTPSTDASTDTSMSCHPSWTRSADNNSPVLETAINLEQSNPSVSMAGINSKRLKASVLPRLSIVRPTQITRSTQPASILDSNGYTVYGSLQTELPGTYPASRSIDPVQISTSQDTQRHPSAVFGLNRRGSRNSQPQSGLEPRLKGTHAFGEWRKSVSLSIHQIKRKIVDSVKAHTKGFTDARMPIHPENMLRVFVVTWNIHGHLPVGNLATLFGIHDPLTASQSMQTDSHSKFNECHFVAVSTQECQQGVDSTRKKTWEKMLASFLSSAYTLVCTESIGGIHLTVFVRSDVADLVTGVISSRISTGIGNVLGNKGSAAIAVQFDGVSILFVDSHFAAHQEKVTARNRDYERTENGMVLPGFDESDSSIPRLSDRFDYVFWAGDLNYRINGTRAIVDSLILNNQLEVLINNDQLATEMHKGKCFIGFQEHPIHFIPTYKFDVMAPTSPTSYTSALPFVTASSPTRRLSGESSIPPVDIDPFGYDSSRKARIPSWTDRILYKSRCTLHKGIPRNTGSASSSSIRESAIAHGYKKPITPEVYSSRMEIDISDHKAVYGIFAINHMVKRTKRQVHCNRTEHGINSGDPVRLVLPNRTLHVQESQNSSSKCRFGCCIQ